ncbi:MAG: hypothetical protein SF187_14285 [Deltaproteobacteria bacterium]|nr:hypothetical protein [Deltaproteobacteria bacterium]
MFSGRDVRGVVVGLAMAAGFAGCATRPVARPSAQIAFAETAKQDDTVRNFERWLNRDVGWTQGQRLRRIERDWMSSLSRLPMSQRRAAATAIESSIRSRRLQNQRERVIQRLLQDDQVALADRP